MDTTASDAGNASDKDTVWAGHEASSPGAASAVPPPDAVASSPLAKRSMENRKMEKDNPAMTDRNLRISGPFSEVLIHDQSSSRTLRDGHRKRHTTNAVALLHYLRYTYVSRQ